MKKEFKIIQIATISPLSASRQTKEIEDKNGCIPTVLGLGNDGKLYRLEDGPKWELIV